MPGVDVKRTLRNGGRDLAVAASRPTRFALEKDRSPPEVGRPSARVPTLLECV